MGLYWFQMNIMHRLEMSDFFEFQCKRTEYIDNLWRNPQPLNMVDLKELLGLDIEDSPF